MPDSMKNLPSIEHLFYNDSGLFHQHVKKTKKAIDTKVFDGLHNLEEKVNHLEKVGAQLKPKGKHINPNIEEAMKFKEEGNKLFKAGRLGEAKDMYTKSLMYCPFNKEEPANNKEYSIILANRSACLDTMGLYESALDDIDCALKYGYPKELKFKIYNRQGHALFMRKQYKESKAAFDKCSDFIGKSDMKTQERERWRIKMAKQKSVFNSAKKGIHNQELPARPWAQQAGNESSLVFHEKEKLVKANKDVNIEEIVHTEKPLACVILDGKHCTTDPIIVF